MEFGVVDEVVLPAALPFQNPRLLVFDESTSALPTSTEGQPTTTVAALRGSTTAVVIAHRLSTVSNRGTLVFLISGRMEAVDSLDDVVWQSCEFASMVDAGSMVPEGVAE